MKRLVLIALGLGLFHAQPVAAEEGSITKMAREAGVSACLPTIAKLEHFLGNKRNYGSWSFWSNNDTDQQPFNASMEISFKDGSVLIDFTVIPASDGTCTYAYTKTWFSPSTCDVTSTRKFMQKAKFRGKINRHVKAYTLGSSEILLQPAGPGCMVQKKEIGFQFDEQDS